MSGRYLNLYMSEETTKQFEFLRVRWGFTGERQQGRVIAEAISAAFVREKAALAARGKK